MDENLRPSQDPQDQLNRAVGFGSHLMPKTPHDHPKPKRKAARKKSGIKKEKHAKQLVHRSPPESTGITTYRNTWTACVTVSTQPGT